MCRKKVFPFIQENLTQAEPAPLYEEYENGIAELGKVLAFAQSDEYYPTFFEKAAYLLTSIAASQYFPNGNKRLAISVLLQFLTLNEITILHATSEEYSDMLKSFFPKFVSEKNPDIQDPHALFLYNLAIILGDRSVWNTADFGILRKKVSDLFELLYWLAD